VHNIIDYNCLQFCTNSIITRAITQVTLLGELLIPLCSRKQWNENSAEMMNLRLGRIIKEAKTVSYKLCMDHTADGEGKKKNENSGKAKTKKRRYTNICAMK
jgi:hypothetical protein